MLGGGLLRDFGSADAGLFTQTVFCTGRFLYDGPIAVLVALMEKGFLFRCAASRTSAFLPAVRGAGGFLDGRPITVFVRNGVSQFRIANGAILRGGAARAIIRRMLSERSGAGFLFQTVAIPLLNALLCAGGSFRRHPFAEFVLDRKSVV